ncbi:MAG TPA: transposase [Verrucomicrobiae bacterium]|nr:transposase [Verrucomicrobiae bacterium]
MERAVARGQRAQQARITPQIGVDEMAVARGQAYITVVTDLPRGTVEHLADERKQSRLDGYFATRSPEQRDAIQAVARDLWAPFAASVRARRADADQKIVFDRFDIMGHWAPPSTQSARRKPGPARGGR